MKEIRFIILLITVFMAMTMLFTSCDETAHSSVPSTESSGTSTSGTTQCEHNYTIKVTTAATCTKDGVKTFTCSVCNDSYTEAIAATGKHDYMSKVTTAATCTKEGVKTFTCSMCSDSYTEAIAATGNHNYTGRVTTAATCSKEGVKTFTCSVCNDFYTEAIAATGNHNYTGRVTTAATCSKEGVKTFTCSVCNDSYTEAIAATGKHNYTSKVTTEATCTKDGVKTFKCSVCNDSYTEAIAATGKHNYTSKVTTEATCTKDGVKTFTCSVCNDSYTESIAAGHKWTNATCTAPKTCSLCECTDGEALGHSYIDATSTTPKTCTLCGHTVGNPGVWYGANTYKVGTDIPAGEYYIKCTSSGMCYFAICRDSSGNSIIVNENFSGHHFVTLENGQYFELVRGECTDVNNITIDVDLKNIAVGMYRVGIDIPAGEYKLNQTSGIFGYFEVYDNSTATRDLLTIGHFENSQYITVYAGEYLYLTHCSATLVQEIESSPTDDNLWSYSEAYDLNTYANKAITNAQKAWDYAIDAMTASSTYKVLYNQYAVYYAGIAKGYLESMKAIADNNAELTLTNTNGKYSTLQEKINYAYELCDEIVNLQITSSNYATYEDKILDIAQELSLECLSIQKLSVDLIGAFAS